MNRLLFDTGVSPDDMVTNMGRLGLAPDSVSAAVCPHGHFDHTTGMDGLARALGGAAKLPQVLHPQFWSRRRIALPGRGPWDLPATAEPARADALGLMGGARRLTWWRALHGSGARATSSVA